MLECLSRLDNAKEGDNLNILAVGLFLIPPFPFLGFPPTLPTNPPVYQASNLSPFFDLQLPC